MASTRKCFLHIGSHKTGTTAIQSLLDGRRDALAERGFLYPNAGIPHGLAGHHNIAWQIFGDPRYRREFGTTDDLFAEIGGTDRDVVMSSEDFAFSFRDMAALRGFIAKLQHSGFAVVLIVYLRSQAEFVRSEYFEALKNGAGSGFPAYLQALIQQDKFWLNGKSIGYRLHYEEFLREVSTIDALKVIVRSYDAVRGGVIADFLSVLGIAPQDIGADESLRANERLPLAAALRQFFRNAAGRPANSYETRIIERFAGISGGDIHITDIARQLIIEKYAASNRALDREFGITLPVEIPTPLASEPQARPHLEDVFSVTSTQLIESATSVFADDLTALTAERDTLSASYRELGTAHTSLTSAYRSTVAERDRLSQHVDALARARHQLLTQHNTLVARHEELSHEHQAAVTQRNALLASASWRVTAPLRAIKSWIAGLLDR